MKQRLKAQQQPRSTILDAANVLKRSRRLHRTEAMFRAEHCPSFVLRTDKKKLKTDLKMYRVRQENKERFGMVHATPLNCKDVATLNLSRYKKLLDPSWKRNPNWRIFQSLWHSVRLCNER
jgi:hypothetical protein